jgi:hypothetical protein
LEGEIEMSITDKNEAITVCQATQHAMLIPWGRFSRLLGLSERLRAAVVLARHKDATPGGDLILEFGLASLAGYEYLQDLNLGPHPLAGEQAVQDAWDIEFRHYTTVSRFLYEVDETVVEQVQAELDAIVQPYIRSAVHEVLCHQEYLTLCGDLTGRPVSAYSSTYPPDTVFGHMANQLRKGHQAALVTFKGIQHRVHVTAFHHSGNTVSSVCLHEMVEATEARLGCRPRRRTDRLRQRIAAIEAKMAQKQGWGQAQQSTIRQQIERQIRLGHQLQALRPRLTELEARYQGKRVPPYSKLAQARKQKASWERQLQAALEQESQARRALRHHQQRLEALTAERDALLNWLAQLEVDNATNPNPVRTIAHNGKTTQVLRQKLPDNAQWEQAGSRTQALDMAQQTLGDCPYPVRLTLLRWSAGDELMYSTLVSFSDAEELPTAELFPTYHQRQDVEAGIKQGKGTFSFTKLRVRSPAGIRLLGQFALVFWPNFVRWAADWMADLITDEIGRFSRLLQQVTTQVRVAARTSAMVLTNTKGQMLVFDADGPYAGVQIPLDRPFAYQFPMPLFQTWQQLWPVSSVSVKEQLATMVANQNLYSPASIPIRLPWAALPEKIPKSRVPERLVL